MVKLRKDIVDKDRRIEALEVEKKVLGAALDDLQTKIQRRLQQIDKLEELWLSGDLQLATMTAADLQEAVGKEEKQRGGNAGKEKLAVTG